MTLTTDEKRRADLALMGLRNMRDWCLQNRQLSEAANFLTGFINALENGTSHPFLEDWERRRDAREAQESAQPPKGTRVAPTCPSPTSKAPTHGAGTKKRRPPKQTTP